MNKLVKMDKKAKRTHFIGSYCIFKADYGIFILGVLSGFYGRDFWNK